MADDYSGRIDWEPIYEVCHGAGGIANRLSPLLGTREGGVVFAGFARAASDLSAERPVVFVDRSEFVVREAGRLYPTLARAVAADILDPGTTDITPKLVISGRLSAFWRDEKAFCGLERLLSQPSLEIAVIDFFDVSAAIAGQRFDFGAGGVTGQWRVLDRHESSDGLGTVVKKQVRYRIADKSLCYTAERMFFDADKILEWASLLPDPWVAGIVPALIPGDPSFVLVLSRFR